MTTNNKVRNLVLENPKINKNILNFIVSPSFVLHFKDSFQSTWACMPGLVSNRITASLCFSMFKL